MKPKFKDYPFSKEFWKNGDQDEKVRIPWKSNIGPIQ